MEYAELAIRNEELRKEVNRRKRKQIYHSRCKYDHRYKRGMNKYQRLALNTSESDLCLECRNQRNEKAYEDGIWKKMKLSTSRSIALPSIETRLRNYKSPKLKAIKPLSNLTCTHHGFDAPIGLLLRNYTPYKSHIIALNIACLGMLAPVHSMYQINFNHQKEKNYVIPRKFQVTLYNHFDPRTAVFDTEMDQYGYELWDNMGSLYLLDKQVTLAFTTNMGWPFKDLHVYRFHTMNLQCDCQQSPTGRVVSRYLYSTTLAVCEIVDIIYDYFRCFIDDDYE